ncbi:immunity 22 family protein [Tenacibaculum sp. MAR_2009_124]|uniref:immunity 22 family protein n=1 Tax=Tenacibaculum sp. MAR_2009_124 TaxID=1250059 RepID=UPI0021019200|nr:immunity 22 family protein [Tenacibaculum sp. MAR_2009_124]
MACKSLNQFMKERYNSKGDVSSLFIEKIGDEYLDNQFQEVDFYENKTNKNEIFEGFSYVESFIQDIPELRWNDFNSIILIYNFEYETKGIGD